MAKKLTIEESELAQLKALSTRVETMRDHIAEASIRHHVLISQYPSVETEFRNYQNEITQKYGNIRLDIKTGEYTKIDENKD